ncbi:MAG TPA: type II toxin-antitoxin system RelE/ParE family toxin [Chthoniobacterales bacterium]
MTWQVFFTRSAEKELARLSGDIKIRVARAIRSLEEKPVPPNATRLKARSEFRIRVGDYRVLYTLDHAAHALTISAIGHRREVYR